jgi:hypothetical protein
MSAGNNLKPIVISLSHWERELILKYGYPFEELREQLIAFKNQRRNRLVEFSKFDLEMTIGDLSRTINHGGADGLEVALDDVASMLEMELKMAGG